MSKKIGVISDTHGLLRLNVMEILQTCDCIIHAGDFDREEILEAIQPLASIYAVKGNNDFWARKLRRSLTFTIDGVNFFLVHDRADVARNLGDTDVVIFGHSHRYFNEVIDGRLWLNPGSCGYQRFGGEASMVVMTVDEGKYEIEKIVVEIERRL